MLVGAEDIGVIGGPAGDADVLRGVGKDFIALAGGGRGGAEKAVHRAAALDVHEFDVGQVEGQYVHVRDLQCHARQEEAERAGGDSLQARGRDGGCCTFW